MSTIIRGCWLLMSMLLVTLLGRESYGMIWISWRPLILMAYGVFLGTLTTLEVQRKKSAYLKEVQIHKTSQLSVNGFLTWSFRKLSVLAAVLLGLGPMVVWKASLIDSWSRSNCYLFGLRVVNMSFKGIFQIIAQLSCKLTWWIGALCPFGWLHKKGYQKMVREAWSNDQQGGWGGIVLKK